MKQSCRSPYKTRFLSYKRDSRLAIYRILIEMAQIIMLSHYKCIDLALFACYSYSRNRVGVGGGVNGKYDSSKSRR